MLCSRTRLKDNNISFNLIYNLWIFINDLYEKYEGHLHINRILSVLQFLLFHLGIEKYMCSLMRKIHLYAILMEWKIYWIVIHSCMKNLNFS